jgi:hypothetical protein
MISFFDLVVVEIQVSGIFVVLYREGIIWMQCHISVYVWYRSAVPLAWCRTHPHGHVYVAVVSVSMPH